MAGARRAGGAVMLAALCLLAGACTPSPGETPSPTPISPVSASPTENAVERQQRLDFEAAEKSYREFRAEYNQLLGKGGRDSASATMKATAAGPYLTEYVKAIRAYDELNYTLKGAEKIVYVRPIGHTDTRLALDVCEDSRSAITYDSSGKVFGKGEIRTAQLDVRQVDGRWKIWAAIGRKVTWCS